MIRRVGMELARWVLSLTLLSVRVSVPKLSVPLELVTAPVRFFVLATVTVPPAAARRRRT